VAAAFFALACRWAFVCDAMDAPIVVLRVGRGGPSPGDLNGARRSLDSDRPGRKPPLVERLSALRPPKRRVSGTKHAAQLAGWPGTGLRPRGRLR
jgi:hypothetical protein